MNENFENNFENEPEVSEVPETTEEFAGEVADESTNDYVTENEAWENEPEDKLFDDMENAFREEDDLARVADGEDAPVDGQYLDMKPRKSKGGIAIVLAIVLLAVVAFAGIKLFGGSGSDMGAGNISNMSFMAVSGDYTYYIEPSTYALCRFKTNPADAEIATENPKENPALFLTDIEGDLYYVSMKNGSFMRYTDGVNDEVVISGQCYYPTYVGGKLYYLSLTDYIIYEIPVTAGVFGEATPVIQTEVYYLNIYQNMLYFIGATDSMLYAVPLDGSMDPVQVSTSQMSYINIADGYIYFMRYPDEAETVTPALCRIPVSDFTVEEVIVDNSYCIYNNYYDGYIYYMNYTPTESEETTENTVFPLYCVKADGSEAPFCVSPEQGVYIQIIEGYVYYLTLGENNAAVWKRLPLGKVDEDGTQAEILPGQELLPLTDEPFALEDLLGEENEVESEELEEVMEETTETEE